MRVTTDLKPSTSSSCLKEAESNAVLSSFTCIHKQNMAKYHAHHLVPVKQHEILHDFLLKIDQGTFGILCGGKAEHGQVPCPSSCACEAARDFA